MDVRTAQTLLNRHGFPCGAEDGIVGPRTRTAVAYFQRAYNNGWLNVDGIPGPQTQAALDQLPRLSRHFTVGEVACHHCGLCYVRRELLRALETTRDHLGTALPIIDAYRCPVHNRDIGGAPNSMHLEGFAADPTPITTWETIRALRLFSGIGDRAGMVAHVDLRHLSPKNETPGANPDSPARWHY